MIKINFVMLHITYKYAKSSPMNFKAILFDTVYIIDIILVK